MNYDRNDPNITDLIEILKVYKSITYGIEAYPLSRAEAELLVNELCQSEDSKISQQEIMKALNDT